ncbi:MAG: class I SAM-dependent rRNA methyltransferase [Ignavibacteriales bacterium]|nr:class I SAM-dependent rRNA methyltransferase [Ignavibacteriales bacterium]
MADKVFLKKNEDKRILSGHLWVFSNEILKLEGEPSNGDLVQVYNFRDELIGTGFYNKNSLIAVRMISFSLIDDFAALFRQRIISANSLRKTFYPQRDSYRMVFSESDFLPGLIIDKYNQTFVLQVYSFGMQKNISTIVQILKEEFSAENIFSKNENYFRQLEGLEETNEIYLGNFPIEIINDGTVNYKINFEQSQKTGFYFDQSDNRFFIEQLTRGKKVLDCFCNSGGFGLHAAKSGAASVTFVDSSANEITTAKKNFELNKFESGTEFITEDVFDYLERISNQEKFDVVMIDPPAFAKNKKSIAAAKKGYEKLNRLALNCTKPNGWLVTSSCSHHLNEADFFSVIQNASQKAVRQVQLIHFNGASFDHPRLISMPETSYLKFAVFKVVD